jgi:hypothetical protein
MYAASFPSWPRRRRPSARSTSSAWPSSTYSTSGATRPRGREATQEGDRCGPERGMVWECLETPVRRYETYVKLISRQDGLAQAAADQARVPEARGRLQLLARKERAGPGGARVKALGRCRSRGGAFISISACELGIRRL